ncbi:MAG: hypothetical protein ACPGVT_11660 [Maricaulaceae bacterium]
MALAKPSHKTNTAAEKAKRWDLSAAERSYLALGTRQAGGKLPLFDVNGQEIKAGTIHSCMAKGYAEVWFANPLKPDWLVCRLTEAGRNAVRSA